MMKGKYTIYTALLKAFHGSVFTPKEAYGVCKENIEPLEDWDLYSNMLGEIHRFWHEGRAEKIVRGVYKLTPTKADLKRCYTATPRMPGGVYDSKYLAILQEEAKDPNSGYETLEQYLSRVYKPKNKRRPVYIYWVKDGHELWSNHPYTLSELRDWMWKELTEPQKEAVRTNKVGKYFGKYDLTIKKYSDDGHVS